MISLVDKAQDLIGTNFDKVLIFSSRLHGRITHPLSRKSLAHIEELMSFYVSDTFQKDPSQFFSFPDRAPRLTRIEEDPFFDGCRRTYCFPSTYKVRHASFAGYFDRFLNNKTAYLVHWSHGDKGRNTIVCCHGWSLGDPKQAERMFNIPRLYSLGLDVALFITPFHWRRAASRAQRVHPPFPFGHPILGLEGFGQAMFDLYSSFLAIKEQGAGRIGLIGASLGGYIAALFVSLTTIAELVAVVVPLVSFEGLHVPPVPPIRDTKQKALLTQRLSILWRIHSPLSYTCSLPPASCLIIAAQGDRLCPFSDVLRLYEHWGKPPHLFLRGGHVLFFPRSERGKAWYGFLLRNGFIEHTHMSTLG